MGKKKICQSAAEYLKTHNQYDTNHDIISNRYYKNLFDDEILDFINDQRPGDGLFYNGKNLLPISIGYSNTSKLYKAFTSPYSIDRDEESSQVNKAV